MDNPQNKPPKPRQLWLATRRLFFRQLAQQGEREIVYLSMREKSVLEKMNGL